MTASVWPERGVSVVVPTVDRERALEEAVRAIALAAKRIDEPVEVIVVDDAPAPGRPASPDATVDGVPVRRVRAADAGRRGPAAARNTGIAAARYDLIAFTDDDARCDPRWLAASVAPLRTDRGLAGVEGAVRLDRESPVDPVRGRLVVNLRGGAYLTASLVVRRAAIDAVGGFRCFRGDDPRWAVPFREDTDLGLRIVEAVGPVVFVPEAIVWHPAETVGVRRLVRVARYFVVDAAFARRHPGAVPRVRERPLARLRIRLATLIVLLLPGLAVGRWRRPVGATVLGLAGAVSVHAEAELRAAGVARPRGATVLDSLARLPRALLWSLAAGGARLQGEVLVRAGRVPLPTDAPVSSPAVDG